MAATTVQVQMQQRRDTAAGWTSANPILLSGEFGFETDTEKFKIGDGSTAWNALGYVPAFAISAYPITTADIADDAVTSAKLATGSVGADAISDGSITNVEISTSAEIAVSKLEDGGVPRQLLQTNAAGTGVEWTSNVDVPGTLDVTYAATFDNNVTIQGNLSVGTITTGVWNGTEIGYQYGGTGLTTAPGNGQLAIGNGSGYTLATLTAGTNITITEGSGSITIDAVTASLKANGGLVFESTELAVDLGASSITGTLGIADGGTGAITVGDARFNLGLAIGTNVQAYDAQLDDIAGLTPSDGGFIVGDGTNFVVESAATARTSLGVDAAGTDNSTDVTLVTTLADYLSISGQAITLGQIDLTAHVSGSLPLANGGTNATTASGARTNLGLAIGSDVQAYDAELAAIAGLTSAADTLPYFDGVGSAAVTTLSSFGRSLIDDADAAAARTTLGLTIGTDVQAYDADTAKLDAAQTFTAQQTFGELKETTYSLTGTAIDPANGSIQSKTVSANTTFTESLEAGQTVVLLLDGGASYTITWPTVTWVTSGGNSAPTLTANDVFVFWKVSTTLYAAYVGSYT